MSSTGELAAADRYCRYLAGRHYENFSVASFVLSETTRRHLARIYAFCRVTDDLGDESDGDGLSRLQVWRREVERCFDGDEPIHPVLLALRSSIMACSLPAQPFLDLIEANLQDQVVTEYQTWDELLAYCTHSAAPVGRMVLAVFGMDRERAMALSDEVCIGLQLANFAQDVSVDRGKGRTYLVQSDIRERGTRGAIQAMCERAESMLALGRELESMVPFRLRVQLTLYRLGGMAIVSAVRGAGYHTDSHRPHLSRGDKVRIAANAVRQASGRRVYVQARLTA